MQSPRATEKFESLQRTQLRTYIAPGYLWLQIINCYAINQQFEGCFLQSGQLSNNKTLIFTLKLRDRNLRTWL